MRAGTSVAVTGNEQNTREWRAAEIPAAGGTSNARGVARVHAMLANGGTLDGVRLLSPEGVDRIFVEQCHQTDAVLGVQMRLGTGFGLMNDLIPLSPNPRSCFWGGWGGSICVVDVDAQVSIAYVMNKMAGGSSATCVGRWWCWPRWVRSPPRASADRPGAGRYRFWLTVRPSATVRRTVLTRSSPAARSL